MEEKKFPKILVLSLSAWRSDSGIQTLPELFRFWDNSKVAQLYLRSDLPNTDSASRFFQISEQRVLRSIFTFKSVGCEVQNGMVPSATDFRELQNEKKLYTIAHRKKDWFLTIVREFVWMMGHWKSKALDKFIDDINPDVLFVPIYPVVYAGIIQKYIIRKTKKPYVCYLWDDNYTYLPCGNHIWAIVHRWMLRRIVKPLAANSDAMFAITPFVANQVDRFFGTHSVVLTRGIDYSGISFDKNAAIHHPIKILYTGNLLIGRSRTLVAISKALGEINRGGVKMVMDIYSTTQPDPADIKYLNENGCSLHNSVPRGQVVALQKQADVLVFVESLVPKHKYAARMSFSTKLTDYLSSGKCIFAVGDSEIAPIIYLRENNAAIISNTYKEIESNLKQLVKYPELIRQYGEQAFETGKRNHEVSVIKETFVQTILKVVRQ